eukprot:Lithocolla_globosa_v1_NODE_1171_length_2812_cov_219.489300.p3 type:complete len:106 gc:universal NODE_1171_length_2812_cov_219.489300:993-676(-)
MAIDQAHEQTNDDATDDGGVTGITENPDALMRFLLTGSDLARLISEFEGEFMDADENPFVYKEHHQSGLSFQRRFHKQVNSLVDVLIQMGNPFSCKFTELVRLDK